MNYIIIILSLIFIITVYIYYFYYKTTVITYTKNKPKFQKNNSLNNELKYLSDDYMYLYSPHDIRYVTQYLNNVKKKRKKINNEQYIYLNINRNNVIDDIQNYDLVENEINNILPEYLTDDKQNIHDSLVQKQSKNGYKNIEKTNNKDIEIFKNEIKKYINDNKLYCESKKNKIINIIQLIYNRNNYISNYNDTEYNILCNTWNNGNDNIKIQLLLNLQECLDEFGNLYCPTGISTRIIESLYIENPENYPKPKEVINQEILHKASILRNKYNDKNLNEFKLILIEELYKDYSNILTKDDLIKNVSEWIDYI